MKKNLFSWMTILMMAIVCDGLTACGGDDDDNSFEVTDNEEKDSGGLVAKDVLKPGIYFCLEATDIDQMCSDAITLGYYNGIAKIIEEYGSSGWDRSALKVEKGDMVGVMTVFASLRYPTDTGLFVVSIRTYYTTTVFYYVDENEDCFMEPWKESPGSRFTYSNGQFVFQGFNGNETVYYKRVK